MSDPAPEISVVIPTYNRATALRLNFPYVLGIEDVGEIVVVVDGSSDETREFLARLDDDRVRVIAHPRTPRVAGGPEERALRLPTGNGC